jgi:hypothetical protein
MGVWKRALLRAGTIDDTTSEVYWLQTATWHADIRIPSGRPALAGKTALQQLTRDELLRLARQAGFAGTTVVAGDVCEWHRHWDYQPPSAVNDVGRMEFDGPNRCLEYGIEQDYFEIWERLPEGRGEATALMLREDGRARLLFRAGDCVMRMRPRPYTLPQAESLAALAANADDTTLADWLDFEISFGRLSATGGCRIALSTLPWLEGEPMEDVEVLSAASAGALGQGARHWQRLE